MVYRLIFLFVAEDRTLDGQSLFHSRDDSDGARAVPEAVHPALALLVAGGVPGEVVVQDRIEVLLEVDAFGEAVGAHEHEPAAPGGEPGDALLALGVRKPAGEGRHHGRIVDELAEDASASFRYLVEEDLFPVPRRRHRFARKLARLELEVLLDRLLEGGLKTRGLWAGARWLEAHDQGVLGVLDERHHPHDAPFARRVVAVRGVGLVAGPVAAFDVEIEAARLAPVLMRPAEVDAVEVGCVAVAEGEHGHAVAQDFRVPAVEPAVDLGETIGGDEVVAEAPPFLFVAGDALREPQAHVLQLHQAVDGG